MRRHGGVHTDLDTCHTLADHRLSAGLQIAHSMPELAMRLQAANAVGIPVFNAPFSNTRSVAELVICEVIALARQLGDRSAELHRYLPAQLHIPEIHFVIRNSHPYNAARSLPLRASWATAALSSTGAFQPNCNSTNLF